MNKLAIAEIAALSSVPLQGRHVQIRQSQDHDDESAGLTLV